MGDMADDFKFLKEINRKAKEDRYAKNVTIREEVYREALDVGVKNDGNHWIVRSAKATIDFWPPTGRWIARKPARGKGYDPSSLLNYIKSTQ